MRRPIEFIVADFYWHIREVAARGNSAGAPPLLRAQPFRTVERIDEPPMDVTNLSLFHRKKIIHHHRAKAKRIGPDQYWLSVRHGVGGWLGDVTKKAPFTLANEALPATVILNWNDAANALARWEAEQRAAGGGAYCEAPKTPFHYSRHKPQTAPAGVAAPA